MAGLVIIGVLSGLIGVMLAALSGATFWMLLLAYPVAGMAGMLTTGLAVALLPAPGHRVPSAHDAGGVPGEI